jgi:hypothetical protein
VLPKAHRAHRGQGETGATQAQRDATNGAASDKVSELRGSLSEAEAVVVTVAETVVVQIYSTEEAWRLRSRRTRRPSGKNAPTF